MERQSVDAFDRPATGLPYPTHVSSYVPHRSPGEVQQPDPEKNPRKVFRSQLATTIRELSIKVCKRFFRFLFARIGASGEAG